MQFARWPWDEELAELLYGSKSKREATRCNRPVRFRRLTPRSLL